jgi:hypothetical protein
MKIAEVRLRQVAGTMAFDGEFWEDRVLRPIDVYPEYAAQGPSTMPRVGSGGYRIETVFVEIVSDEGLVGIGGPITREQAFLIDTEMRPYLEGGERWRMR